MQFRLLLKLTHYIGYKVHGNTIITFFTCSATWTQRARDSCIKFQFTQHIYLRSKLLPTSRSASGKPNGDLAEEILHYSLVHSTSKHLAQPNYQTSSGSAKRIKFLILQDRVQKRRLASIRRHYSGKSSLSFAANHYSNNDQYTGRI